MKQIGGWLILPMRPWLLAVLLTCPSPAAGQAALPAEVLVGTDLKPLVSFRFTKARPIEPGNYASESGGATLEITIRASLELIRVFQEPGEKQHSRVYSGLTRAADKSYRAKGIVVRVPDDGGLLVLERASGREEIPASFWIFYGGKK